MNSEEFAEFFKKKGKRVVKTASGYWYEIHPFCFQNIPYHYAIDPHKGELRSLFFKKSALLLRFNSCTDQNSIPGYVWICNDKNYSFANLKTKIRNRTRKGLERNLVKLIGFDLLMKEGWKTISDTLQRQGRDADFATPEEWVRYCEAAAGLPGFDAWGAFVQDRLVSFLVGAEIDDYYWILRQYSETAFLKDYPNNALIYTITKSKLSIPAINKISYGFDSVEDTAGLRKFKQGMGFFMDLYNQKILINPLFKWMINKRFTYILKILLKLSPKNNYLKKTNAIFNKIQVN